MLRQDCSSGVGKATADHPPGKVWEDRRQQMAPRPLRAVGAAWEHPSTVPAPSPPADVPAQILPCIIWDGDERLEMALLSQFWGAGMLRGFVSN